jgi:two-component system sensor histidine kinase/response regulator
MDGYEATRAVRGMAAFKSMPILAMTANTMVGDRDKALAAGMNDHIAKPLNIGQMFEVLARWIKPAVERQALAGREPTAPTTPATEIQIEGIDTLAGLRVCIGNATLYRKMLSGFVSGQSGFGAACAQAIQAGDRTTATRLAHTLKGNAGNIGAVAVQAHAAMLEQALRGEAAAEAIDAHIAATLRLLHPVMGAIEAFLERSSATPALAASEQGASNATPAELSARLNDLRNLLCASEALASLRLEELCALAGDLPQRVALDNAAKALLGYDFDAALDALAAVRFEEQG